MPKRLTRSELEQKIKELDSNFELDKDYNFDNYKNNKSIIQIKHSCGNVISCYWKNFQEGHNKCTCEVGKNFRRIKYDSREKIGRGKYLIKENYLSIIFNDPDYELVDNPVYSGHNNMKVRVHHKTCDTYFYTTPNRFQQGNRCPECANLIRVGALPGSGSCKIRKYLQDHNVFFTSEKKFDDCIDKKRMPFDYEDANGFLIEFDGEQHFHKGKRGYDWAVRHDKMKNSYCRKTNKTLLRIPYNEESNINEILDAFYNKDYTKLCVFNIFLISPDLEIKTSQYYTEKCRSKTMLTAGRSNGELE